MNEEATHTPCDVPAQANINSAAANDEVTNFESQTASNERLTIQRGLGDGGWSDEDGRILTLVLVFYHNGRFVYIYIYMRAMLA